MGSSLTLPLPSDSSSVRACLTPHPNRDWPPPEIIEHIVAMHHSSLRSTLAELRFWLQTFTQQRDPGEGRWDIILPRFIKVHDALLFSMDWEESELFPRFAHWHATDSERTPPHELLAAVNVAERSHASALQMLWRLLRLTRDESSSSPRASAHQQFSAQLTAIASNFEQHLFEVECLLLPIISNHHSFSSDTCSSR